jgi:hypothetical protein
MLPFDEIGDCNPDFFTSYLEIETQQPYMGCANPESMVTSFALTAGGSISGPCLSLTSECITKVFTPETRKRSASQNKAGRPILPVRIPG